MSQHAQTNPQISKTFTAALIITHTSVPIDLLARGVRTDRRYLDLVVVRDDSVWPQVSVGVLLR